MRFIPMRNGCSSGWDFRPHFGYCVHPHHSVVRSRRSSADGGEVWLKYLQGKTTVWWTIVSLCVLTDFLYIPVALALYLALERVNRSAMLLASIFVGLFVALDLAVTWANYAALLTLSGLYAGVTNEVQRAGYVAAANYASAVLASPIEVFYAIVDLSIGIFIIGFVMWKERGIFKRTTAFWAWPQAYLDSFPWGDL
jgi:hypothetical protein